MLEFGRKAAATCKRRGLGKPETFTFLGLIFICGKSRRGAFQLQRKTRRDRMRARLREIKEQLRERMHEPIPEQGRWLKQVVTGFFAYHAVPTNSQALGAFRHHVTDLWRRTLRRRSQKDGMTWARITKIADAWLPQPESFIRGPTSALPSLTPGGSPVRELRTLGSVRGASGNRCPYRDPRPKADIVRPAKAGAFSGRQSHRGKSRSPVAWVAGSQLGNRDPEAYRQRHHKGGGESPGRSASEREVASKLSALEAEPAMSWRRQHGSSRTD